MYPAPPCSDAADDVFNIRIILLHAWPNLDWFKLKYYIGIKLLLLILLIPYNALKQPLKLLVLRSTYIYLQRSPDFTASYAFHALYFHNAGYPPSSKILSSAMSSILSPIALIVGGNSMYVFRPSFHQINSDNEIIRASINEHTQHVVSRLTYVEGEDKEGRLCSWRWIRPLNPCE